MLQNVLPTPINDFDLIGIIKVMELPNQPILHFEPSAQESQSKGHSSLFSIHAQLKLATIAASLTCK